GNLFRVGGNFRVGNLFRAGNDFRAGNNFLTDDGFRAGNGFKADSNFMVGNGFRAGHGFMVGDKFRADNDFEAGNDFRAGNYFTVGNGFDSSQANINQIAAYKAAAKTHLFVKWVNKRAESPGAFGTLKYDDGAIVEVPDAEVSDVQCGVGIHVFQIGYKPEWVGHLYYDATPKLVRVRSEDICFAGYPGDLSKLRVRRVEVIGSLLKNKH
ncbi:MAG: hypothetical protein U9Q61_11815, partial [Thermodesulfobacteriota bacterium]|nr:hypothetical protein [Thermodesulfobacteriota bacterium]